jgi:hypothetical protein
MTPTAQLNLLDVQTTGPAAHKGGDGVAAPAVSGGGGGATQPYSPKNFAEKILTAFDRVATRYPSGWWLQANSVAFEMSEREYLRRIATALELSQIEPEKFYGEICRQDRYFLGKYVLGHPLTWVYHKPKMDLSQSLRNSRALFLEPRFWGKTTTETITASIQDVLIDPNDTILLWTGVSELATKILEGIKSHFLSNDSFRSLFPQYCPPRGKDWGNTTEATLPSPLRTNNRMEPTFMAASLTTSLTGFHFGRIRADDLINEKNCTTREQIQFGVDKFQKSFPLLLNPATGPYTLVGTRYDFADVYGHVLDKLNSATGGDFTCVVQSAETADGQAACPLMMDGVELQKLRATLGPVNFAAQMRMNPTTEHQSVSQSDFDGCWHNDTEADLRRANLYLLTDAAFSKRESADYCGLIVAAVLPKPDAYWDVIEYTRAHMDPRAFLEQVWRYWDKYKPLGGFQAITVQSATLDQVLAFFLNEDMQKRNEFLPIHRIELGGIDKIKRITRAVTRLKQKKLRLRRDMFELQDELLRYPKAPHDDLSDPLSDLAEVGRAPEAPVAAAVLPSADLIDMSLGGMWRAMSRLANNVTLNDSDPVDRALSRVAA